MLTGHDTVDKHTVTQDYFLTCLIDCIYLTPEYRDTLFFRKKKRILEHFQSNAAQLNKLVEEEKQTNTVAYVKTIYASVIYIYIYIYILQCFSQVSHCLHS